MDENIEKKLEEYGLILVYENVPQIDYSEEEKALMFSFADKECCIDYIKGVIGVYVFSNFESLIDFFEKKSNNLVLISPEHCKLWSFIMYNVKYVFARNFFTELYIIL
jgi:hypothetical protein